MHACGAKGMTLIFDFGCNQINGVILSEKSPDDIDSFANYGIRIAVQKGVTRSILFCMYDGYLDLKPYAGKFTLNKNEFTLNCYDTPDSIKTLFGTPDEEWDDGSEHNCTYKRKGSSIEFCWLHMKRGTLLAYVSIDDYRKIESI